MVQINAEETLDDLIVQGMRIIQKKEGFRFTLDAVLLAGFVTVKARDRIADLGTGTGIIPLLLSARDPSLTMCGMDIQAAFVEMARRSVSLNGLEDRVQLVCADLRDHPCLKVHGCFQVVTANPPYWVPGKGRISPNLSKSMARHQLTASISEFIEAAAALLTYKGRLALIYQSQAMAEILELLKIHGFQTRRMRLIHNFIHKPAHLILLEAHKGVRPGTLTVEPPLVVYESRNVYSQEILNWSGRLTGKGAEA
jgi:tRNA1Val (adenine37-N6)-methyltransferase